MPSTAAWLAIPANQEKVKASRKKWKEANKDKEKIRVQKKNIRFRMNNPLYYKDKALQSKYNITYDDYVILYNTQEGRCKVCKVFCPLESKTFTEVLNVDHCHTTGKIRGLLCHKCNKALGLFQDNIDTLQCAITYLQGGS